MPAKEIIPLPRIETLIYEVRGQRIMLDSDLAEVYGVPTKSLNRAVKRHADRFPKDFLFRLTRQEFANLRCQFGTSSSRHGGRRFLPYAFTEHGAIMVATVLNSSQAVQMSVFVVRAFLKMRAVLNDTRSLARKLAALEKDLKDRLNVHEAAIVTILQRVMDILDPRRNHRLHPSPAWALIPEKNKFSSIPPFHCILASSSLIPIS
jgi:phage regulator Rha-like protein